MAFEKWFAEKSIIPVATIDDVAKAVPLAEKLHADGVATIEITLRTSAALAAIAAIKASGINIIIGAGTVLEPAQAVAAQAAGAEFLVSPGFSPKLAAAIGTSLPWLPGVATVTEAMQARAAGYKYLKFFPAEASGGVAWLKSVAAVLPDVKFCPTGGITRENNAAYLACANVFAVGGSWLV